jgi:hypothetical protein
MHPQITTGGDFGGWVVYGMNISKSPLLASLWHTDPGVLSSLCGWKDSGCQGFSSRGFLIADAGSAHTVQSQGVTLWLKI